jgi:hypothetical protein
MNRRGFMSVLGLGAAAGPLVAQEAVLATPFPSTAGIGYSITKEAYDNIPWNPVESLARAKAEYNTLIGDPSAWVADYVAREMDEYLSGYGSIRLETIDPDIRNMKSLSESAKIRMAIERKAKRRYQASKNSMFQRIQELMKEV